MKEKLFNKKQIKALSEAEKYFNTVVNAQYKSSSPVTLNNKVADLYEAATGEKLRREWGCSRCTFNVFKKAALLYYKSIEALEVKKIADNLEEQYKKEFEETTPNEEQDTTEEQPKE